MGELAGKHVLVNIQVGDRAIGGEAEQSSGKIVCVEVQVFEIGEAEELLRDLSIQ